MKALLAWLILGAAALADVQVTVHVIELPQERTAELVAGSEEGDALFKKARALVKQGQGRTFDTVITRVASGERSTAESIHEHMSPAKVDQSSWPGPGGRPAEVRPAFVPQIRLPYVPTSFQTRNVGGTLEAEAAVAEGGLVDLRGAWDFVIRQEDTVSDDWTDDLGNRSQIRRPSYVSFKTSCSRTLASGKWMLISVQSGSDAAGKIDPSKKLLVFLKADDLHPVAHAK